MNCSNMSPKRSQRKAPINAKPELFQKWVFFQALKSRELNIEAWKVLFRLFLDNFWMFLRSPYVRVVLHVSSAKIGVILEHIMPSQKATAVTISFSFSSRHSQLMFKGPFLEKSASYSNIWHIGTVVHFRYDATNIRTYFNSYLIELNGLKSSSP